jgi:hypothetical protein
MKLAQELRIIAGKQTDLAVATTLGDAATMLDVCEHITDGLVVLCDNIHADLKRMKVPARLAKQMRALHMLVGTVDGVHGYSRRRSPNGAELIRYDKMDPALPPRKVELEVCPNCGLVGRVKRHKEWVKYTHAGEETKGGKVRPRHYCKLYNDGLRMDVVMPVMPKEDPCVST